MKKGKLFGLFNAVDLVVAVLIVLAALFAVWFLRRGSGGGDEVWVYYTVEAEGQLKGFNEVVSVGDAISDTVRNYAMGNVSSVSAKASKNWQFNEDTREFFEYVYENEEITIVTIKARAKETADYVRLSSGGGDVRVGKRLFLQGKGYTIVGYIVEFYTEAGQ